MNLPIVQNRKYFYTLSALLILVSFLSLIAWGLKPGIDFTGGSLMEVSFKGERPASSEIQQALADLDLGEIRVQPAGEQDFILRFKDVEEAKHQEILAVLKDAFVLPSEIEQPDTTEIDAGKGVLTEQRFESVGPIVGQELKQKTWLAIFLATLMIVAYIAYAFRKVSKPVASWKFGVAAILALIHDILIVTGLFSLLGHFAGVEVDSLFITALLTILGFSVHDTIVVFDRTRENLSKRYSGNFEQVVNDSINQTISRSINTSLTTLLALFALYFGGGDTITNFVLALIVGMVIGTYSSIFVASPIVVSWYNIDRKLKSR
ncbi:MAG TPA: protein translocase subunit SecF [bacterium]|nr:protein translocase subunit SecF [bacterium]HPN81132.1 protein translocase subunit SecF [bacterium]HPW39150.1 protein translocase subunit SecF [bacterium]